MGIKHTTQTVKSNDASKDVSATAWNAEHEYLLSATDKVLGRATTGAGAVEEIACTAAGRALLDDADAAAQRTTLGAKGDNVSATDKVLGRVTAGAGAIEEIACTAAGRALLDDAAASDQRATLGLGGMATQAASAVAITGGAISGITDLAIADGGTGAGVAATALANLGGVPATRTVNAKALSGDIVLGLASADFVNQGAVAQVLHGNATGNPAFGAIVTADITAKNVTYAKIQDVSATDKLLGRVTAAAGVIEEIACTAAGRALLDDADAAAQRTTLGAKNDNVSATDKLLGRVTAGAGAIEEIACTAAGRALLDDADAAAQRTTLGIGAQEAAIWLGAEAAYLPATNPAVFGEAAGATTYAGWAYLAFDDTTAQMAVWRVPLPNYNNGNIVVTAYSKPQTTPGGAKTLQYNIFTIGLTDNEDFDAAVLTDTTVNISHTLGTGTLSTEVHKASGTIDPANVAADDILLIGLQRDVATDDLVGNGQLLGILIEYVKS